MEFQGLYLIKIILMQGVVTKISHDGLVISLWGDMRGFAPRSHLSTETIEYPEKLFFIGQVRFSSDDI
jgi:ribosomal protein S1